MARKIKSVDLKSEIKNTLEKYGIAAVELRDAALILNQDPPLLLSDYEINKDIVDFPHTFDLYRDTVSVEGERLKRSDATNRACQELEKIADSIEKEDPTVRLKIYNKKKIIFFRD